MSKSRKYGFTAKPLWKVLLAPVNIFRWLVDPDRIGAVLISSVILGGFGTSAFLGIKNGQNERAKEDFMAATLKKIPELKSHKFLDGNTIQYVVSSGYEHYKYTYNFQTKMVVTEAPNTVSRQLTFKEYDSPDAVDKILSTGCSIKSKYASLSAEFDNGLLADFEERDALKLHAGNFFQNHCKSDLTLTAPVKKLMLEAK